MTVAALLVAYTLLIVVLVPRLLRGAGWPDRAPRLAVGLWLALSWSALGAAVLAGVALTVPSVPLSTDLASMLHACVVSLQDSYATPAGAVVAASGLVVVAGLLVRVACCAVAGLARAARARRDHAVTLEMVGHRAAALDAVVVTHDVAAVYCLPGRHRRIVLTSAALDVLGERELAAVLAHERAHLAGRHHLILGCADVLARAFPAIPLFALARREIGRLLELSADDVAARQHPRLSIAAALAVLAGGGEDIGLAASGPTALGRVRRLLTPAHPLGPGRTALGGLLIVTALVVPVLVATGPLLGLGHALYCPLPAGPPSG